MEDAINYLLEEHKKYEKKSPEFIKKVEQDRERFLRALKNRVEGAGPEDFVEYNFEDV